jgi:hypothetical protein
LTDETALDAIRLYHDKSTLLFLNCCEEFLKVKFFVAFHLHLLDSFDIVVEVIAKSNNLTELFNASFAVFCVVNHEAVRFIRFMLVQPNVKHILEMLRVALLSVLFAILSADFVHVFNIHFPDSLEGHS